MCGRFAQAIPVNKLKKIDIFSNFEKIIPANYNLAPGETSSIVIFDSKYKIINSKWGFVNKRFRLRTGIKPFINARSETVSSKSYFKSSFDKNRCVIPVNGFYEWEKKGKIKQPYFIYYGKDPDSEYSIMFLAGIYSFVDDQPGDSTFAVITTASVSPVSALHERMPVIISSEDLKQWLNPDADPGKIMNMFDMKNTANLLLHPVVYKVNSPLYKGMDCIERFDESELFTK